jgi:hypothetical protein
VAGEIGTEVVVALAEHQRGGYCQVGELSGCDALVLALELGVQGCGPVSDGGQCVRAAGVTEELRDDGRELDAVGSSSPAPNCRAVCWRNQRRWSGAPTRASASGAKSRSANSRIISGSRNIGAWP